MKQAVNFEKMHQLRKRLEAEQRALLIRKFLRNKQSVAGLVIVLIVLLAAIFGPIIIRTSPYTVDVSNQLKPPSAEHWFGTDILGRDVFTRVVYGARISMIVGLSTGILSGALGMIIGLYASHSKVLDNILMRICDGLKSIPSILLAIALMTALGADIKNVIISLAVVSTPSMAQIARSAALVVKEQTYIEAMKGVGARSRRILFRHIAPNIISPMIVQMTFVFASAIITEAALSFLGAGIPAPQPSWGSILSDGRGVIYQAQWLIVFPGIITALTVLGLNLFGDGMRDLLDPLSN
ncbi:glutathione transport system permease protein GsiD [Treponema primitia ZAS-2]|uniref:Glutathione transport system permease protein GsiD n=1 Tax=Treponema primitia (strain ATCC BAA-887 / DSM 12427 / ZAS-2) TaxID=545694 RepID=F5YKH7_TREPZ|nr:ABC transporter permease [Treponema primitia]AEF84817.1 glutathione transport system permease protein GsiD [Treponema primitia ZAS-2]